MRVSWPLPPVESSEREEDEESAIEKALNNLIDTPANLMEQQGGKLVKAIKIKLVAIKFESSPICINVCSAIVNLAVLCTALEGD